MRHRAFFAIAVFLAASAAAAGEPEIRIIKPSNTGIPGEEVRFLKFGPDDRLWVAARWPFWGEGGLGIYDFNARTWETWANWETPIPSQFVNDLEFAADGTIWIATDGGLIWKDGEEWTIFNGANSPLLHDSVRNIALAPDGAVWINNSGVQTTDAAAFRYDGAGGWQRFDVGAELPWELPWKQLGAVYVTRDGHAWVTNEVLNGVAEYDGETWTLHGANTTRFRGIVEDLDGFLWLLPGVGGGNAFYKLDREARQFTAYSSANTPFVNTTLTTLHVADDGTVYAGNWAGQVIATENAGQSWSLFTNVGVRVHSIAERPNGHVWISSAGAARHYDEDGVWQEAFNTWNSGFPDYFVDRFDLDRAGNFWVATGEAGISRFDDLRWRNWGEHNGDSEPYPWAGNEPMGGFYLDRDGVGWMGGNGIGRWDPESGQFTGFWNWQNNPGIGVTLFTHFVQDAEGTLFAATQYGNVYSFDGNRWNTENVPHVGYISRYPGLFADASGRVWAIGWLDAFMWDGNGWTQVGQDWDIFDRGGINAFAIAPDDSLWVGLNDGLLHVEPEIQTFYTPANSPLPALQVQGIDVRRDGLIGVSAHEFGPVTPFPSGVAIIDGDPNQPSNWSIYGYGTHPIPHYQLGAVKFDGNGDLWVSAISEGCSVIMVGATAGDVNCDGAIDAFDIEPFVMALSDPNGYAARYPGCKRMNADIDGDGAVDAFDIEPFIALLTNP